MDYIIKSLHLLFYLLLIISPFIYDCSYKLNSCVILIFILFHFVSKYGKCGIINIERFFLKEYFKNGFFYKLIKPVIDYRQNIFFDKLYYLHILYILILLIQIYQDKCLQHFIKSLQDFINYIKKLIF